MQTSKTKRQGFSLIEMVIVILILGIIAAVTAPRMFDTASKAEKNSTKQQLSILRNAIEMYRAEAGFYPPNGELETALQLALNGPFPVPQFGNAKNKAGVYYDGGSDSSVDVSTSPSPTQGWAYRPADGRLKLNVAAGDESFNW